MDAKTEPKVKILAAETLCIYVVHVLVLYAAGVGVLYVVGRHQPPAGAILGAALMVAFSALVALGWSRWKTARKAARHRKTSVLAAQGRAS